VGTNFRTSVAWGWVGGRRVGGGVGWGGRRMKHTP